jgi:hypothetical protein
MANITVRRASKIRNKIEARLAEIRNDLFAGITVSVFVTETDIAGILSKASQEFSQLFARYSALSNTAYELRARIGNSNAVSGVNTALTRLSALNSQRDLVRRILASARPTISTEQAQARLELLREQVANGKGYTNDIQLNVNSQETLNSLKSLEAALSRDVDATHDALERLNSSAEVELSDADVALLTAEGIL